MALLAEAVTAAFRIFDLSFAQWEADNRDAGLQTSSHVVAGEHGPELQCTVEGVMLRVWATPAGPGCRTKGAPVIGFVWARVEPVSSDRPVGVVCLSGESPVWRALKQGDLPADGVITITPTKMRYGTDRVAELLNDELKPTAIERWKARVSQNGGD